MIIIEKSRIISPDNRLSEHSKEVNSLINVIYEFKEFDLNETRIFQFQELIIEILLVDVKCPSIKSKNSIGILNREPLAIIYIKGLNEHQFRVVPIRENFPEDVLHMNFPFEIIPKTLCLYLESWDEVERSWTPQKFLNRICWWFIKTSEDKLHSNEQELERPYFISEYKLLLPTYYEEEKSFAFANIDKTSKVIRISNTNNFGNCNFLTLEVKPIEHTRVFPAPSNLKLLEEQFQKRSSSVIDILKKEILLRTPSSGFPIQENIKQTFILLKFKRYDSSGNLLAKPDFFAFYIPKAIGELGHLLGILSISPTDPNKYYKIDLLGIENISNNDKLSEIGILPVEIVKPLTQNFATMMSGIEFTEASFDGVLIGVGSLGSTLAEIWSKSGWGRWSLFDNDSIAPHNVFRHLAKEKDIGRKKAELVAELMNQNYSPGNPLVTYTPKRFSPTILAETLSDNKSIDLIVDASASSFLLRDISFSNELPRACSLFFNQIGTGGVLFLEDIERSKRLDFIEASYLRALITEEWGENFLQNNIPMQRVGASCSDLSVVLSYERVILLSSSLSNLLRLKLKSNNARLCILKLNSETGHMDTYEVELFSPKSIEINGWNIFYDSFIEDKLKRLRASNLPKETGGVVIGYTDQKTKSIYIVDITNEPRDSRSSTSGFERGCEGLKEYLDKVKKRTSENCDYIGDWHSHPAGHSSEASLTDLTSLNEFAKVMNSEGMPILMIIVSEDIRFYIK
ncbi:ThiF family adenylyltransferase [Leptospira paudalimensis]|uniref:ThiF family adenylyltransferase n=1 Tax=Leptospira paudalimensis TaxID=2950024 RepID=A0ABT3M679_9LEPT|nr:ThiF family adenylyltransferase [Leptospira paudalimensis]MCW7503890.1 ThiF family adenylyltransferase [Leptospira paudalimensis]